jgi:hypothetical protein
MWQDRFPAGQPARPHLARAPDQPGCNGFDPSPLDAHRAGRGVPASQVIENCSPNPEDRVGAERQTSRQVEAVQRFHQAERPGAHQLAELDRWNPAGYFPRNVMNQTEVTHQKLGAGLWISGAAVSGPERVGAGLGFRDRDRSHTAPQVHMGQSGIAKIRFGVGSGADVAADRQAFWVAAGAFTFGGRRRQRLYHRC